MKKINFKKLQKNLNVISAIALLISIATPVYAADDPVGIINNLSNYIFSITRAAGTIIVIFSIIQFGMSFQTHDASQKTNSVFGFIGGLIIMFAKEIIAAIS